MPLNNSLSFRRRSYTVESSHTTPVEQQEVITEKQQKIPYKTISVNKEYSNSFHLDNQFTIEKAINNLEHELSLEMEKYQQLKNESKKHFVKIHQILGGLDILKTLANDYDLKPKSKN